MTCIFAIFFSFFRGRGRNRAPTPTFRQASIPTVVPKPLKVIQNVSPQVIPNSTEFTKSASVVIFLCLGGSQQECNYGCEQKDKRGSILRYCILILILILTLFQIRCIISYCFQSNNISLLSPPVSLLSFPTQTSASLCPQDRFHKTFSAIRYTFRFRKNSVQSNLKSFLNLLWA